jgi:hypothetical protein
MILNVLSNAEAKVDKDHVRLPSVLAIEHSDDGF